MHDNFIRNILADKEMAAGYFANCLPTTVSSQLDFSTLEQLPDTYLSEELRKTMSDIVYTCGRKDGKGNIKVSLLVEHKSYPDKHTPIQIGGYIFSALQKQVSNNEPLSLVIPVLLYHGKDKWKYQTLSGLFDGLDDGLKQFLPDFAYIYNNLNEMPDWQAEALENKFLGAFLLTLKHSFEKEWLGNNALKMMILASEAPEGLQKSFIIYLFGRSEQKEAAIRDLLESLSLTLKNTVMSTLDIFVEKGRKEGWREAEAKKNYEVVRNLLLTGRFSIAEIANIVSVSEAFVIKVRELLPQ